MEEEMSMISNATRNATGEALDSNSSNYSFRIMKCRRHDNSVCASRQLLQKELTPSDVGKLNPLVIPKKYALKYFPHISEGVEENVASGGLDDKQLVFYDRLTRSWKFRYCYWKSSQNFVFTRGWYRFVKAKDMVVFSISECKNGSEEGQAFCMIDLKYNDGIESNGGVVENIHEDAGHRRVATQYGTT
ncbi:hypothetical protein F0562_009304 [Nyssa sinensis]|uniref:TF-B3 domain-containing protein n=1 Tax=Nyssa sinensis TaxID=561372 RepID=A0A5J5A0J7_9ASTE|nr:hypothetical protein F0562_009304 [Nyssa sinensis]